MNEKSFLRPFSKATSKEERAELALDIKSKRNSITIERSGLQDQIVKSESEKSALEIQLKGLQSRIEELNKTLANLSSNKILKILNFFKIRDLKKQNQITLREVKSAKASIQVMESSNNLNHGRLNYLKNERFKLKRLLEDFYLREKNKWANQEFNKEEVAEYFTEEYLSKLDIEAWGLLLKRFPSHLLTHVTRQGIRDHFSMLEHHYGLDNFHNGFTSILQTGNIDNAISIFLGVELTKDAIAKFLHLDENSKEAAIKYVLDITKYSDNYTSRFEDLKALHFACDDVLNEIYGGESNNEIFFVFPSLMIASQYLFQGRLNDGSGGQHNDKFVWTKDHQGISINAGVVFLPKDTMVSRAHGSRYKLDRKNRPHIDTERISMLKKFIETEEFKNNFCNDQRFIELLNTVKFNSRTENFIELMQKHLGEELYNEKLKFLLNAGIIDTRLQKLFFDYNNLLYRFRNALNLNGELDLSYNIKSVLAPMGLLYKEDEDLVRSEDYWTSYFNSHPEVKPSKIYFYNGDPSEALNNFKRWFGLYKVDVKPDLGFQENQRRDPTLKEAAETFRSTCLSVIQEYYNSPKSTFSDGTTLFWRQDPNIDTSNFRKLADLKNDSWRATHQAVFSYEVSDAKTKQNHGMLSNVLDAGFETIASRSNYSTEVFHFAHEVMHAVTTQMLKDLYADIESKFINLKDFNTYNIEILTQSFQSYLYFDREIQDFVGKNRITDLDLRLAIIGYLLAKIIKPTEEGKQLMSMLKSVDRIYTGFDHNGLGIDGLEINGGYFDNQKKAFGTALTVLHFNNIRSLNPRDFELLAQNLYNRIKQQGVHIV